MNRLFFFLNLLFATFPLQAQINAEDSTVQTVAYWEKRDTMTYLLTKIKIEERENVPDTVQKNVYRLTMTIDDSTETSYTVRWNYYLLEMKNKGFAMPILPGFRKFTDYTLVIQTDEMGGFREWSNWRDVKVQMDKLLALQQLGKQDSTSVRTKETVKKLMDDPDLYYSAFKELKVYFMFYGYKYGLQQAVTDTLPVDYAIGNGTIAMESTTWLDAIDTTDQTYVMLSHQTIDKTQFKTMMDDMVKTIAPEKAGEPLVTEEFLRDFTFDDSIGAILHGPSGWIIRMEYIREASITPAAVTYEEIYLEIE